MEGVTLYFDEFPSTEKTESRSCTSSAGESLLSSGTSLDRSNSPESPLDGLIMCGKLTGRHEITIRLKQSDTLSGPKVHN